jgi:hypothetical protein
MVEHYRQSPATHLHLLAHKVALLRLALHLLKVARIQARLANTLVIKKRVTFSGVDAQEAFEAVGFGGLTWGVKVEHRAPSRIGVYLASMASPGPIVMVKVRHLTPLPPHCRCYSSC